MKKIIWLLAISSYILSFSFVYAENTPSTSFSDVHSEHPHEDAVAYLKSEGIIQGYSDGTFMPDYTINRAEFIKIVIGVIEKDPKGDNCFVDVKTDWYAKYVCTAKERGIIQGYSDGTFRPSLNISIVEASKVLARAFDIDEQNVTSEIWFKPYIETLQKRRAIPVSIDYPDKKITRAEMSEMAYRLKANVRSKPSKTYTSLTAELPRIDSCAELEEKINLQSYKSNRYLKTTMFERTVMSPESAEEGEGAAIEDQAQTVPPISPGMSEKNTDAVTNSGGENDYSSTNVQVEGVDEADVVKNDGKYIYLIKGKTVRIVEATPTEGMKELQKISLDGEKNFNPEEMYTTENRLVIVGNSYDEKSRTSLYVYDITDRTNVTLKRKLSFDGNYVSSRRIGNVAYFVMNEYPQIYNIAEDKEVEEILPEYFDSVSGKEAPMVRCGDIRFFPRYNEVNYLIVASVPLDETEGDVERQVFMGSGSTIYSSLENMYVATQKYEYNDLVRYDIWEPPVVNESTVFYRFQLKSGNIDFKGSGSVPGRLLNQFSMDEEGNAFRVATTDGHFWGAKKITNQLLILDRDNLNTILGKVENIGVGETIKSVRFMGKRAYVVTFKNTDPFFVIDVSEPAAPKILGELKIPGYSDYLHPYDENYIIGFGKEAVEASENDAMRGDFAWYQGMKIALFDVRDVTNPKLKFNETIGDRGTNSEVLYNHKALLFSKSKNLIAFPIEVAEVKEKDPAKPDPSAYGQIVFRGAYVYSLDLEKGFQLRGKISHFDTQPGPNEYDFYGINSPIIKRMLYIGENLYSVSMAKIQAHKLADITKIGEVALEKAPEPDFGYPEPMPLSVPFAR